MSWHRWHTRISRLEVRTVALGGPTAVEVYEAEARLQAAALAAFDALLHGRELPGVDAAQEQADLECLAEWRKTRGLPPVDVAKEGAEFDDRIRSMVRRVNVETQIPPSIL